MNITATSTIGKAGIGARWNTTLADATETQVKTLAEFGIIYLQQRNSEVDAILGITRKVTGEDGKTKTIRTGVKRGDVEVTPEMRDELAKTLGTLNLPNDMGSWKVETSVVEYEGETSGPAYKRSCAEITKLVNLGVLTAKQGETAIAKIMENAGV
jgi:ribosomal protein S9